MFYTLVALDDNKVIAGLTAYELPSYYNDQSEFYIYDIAVESSYRKRGIARELIKKLKSIAIKKNVDTIFVQAHAEGIPAVKLYKSTFDEEEQVVHFNLNIS